MPLKSLIISLFSLALSVGVIAQSKGVFIENKGQWDEQYLYSTITPAGNLFLSKNSFHFRITDVERFDQLHQHRHDFEMYESGDVRESCEDSLQNHYYLIDFLNSNPNPRVKGNGISHQYFNYFIGAESSKWASKAYGYESVTYENIYPGIELVVNSIQSSPKYDFIVQASADPSVIKMKYEGPMDLYIYNNQLYIETSLGLVREDQPYAYQIIDNERVEIPANFILNCDTLSFEFPDGYNEAYELIIDPLLIFSTYSGSAADNWGNTATPGENGKLYSGGIANHYRNGGLLGEFPATPGAYQTTWGGVWDIAIIKYDSSGSQMEYATYLGGNGTEVPHSIIMDHNEDLVIFGTTNSLNFPTTAGAYLRSFQGGTPHSTILAQYFDEGSDMFIAKLSKDGTELKASTYFGGNGNDGQNLQSSELTKNYGDQQRGEVIVDEENNIYVSSVSSSESLFENVSKSFHSSYNGGDSDAILIKMNPDLSELTFGGYLGGLLEDTGFSVRVNSEGLIYAAGGTASINFPVTKALDTIFNGNIDGWIARINAEGDSILSATYLGTQDKDQIYFLDTDEFDNIYVLGQTNGNYPVQGNVYNNPSSGQFIHKLSSDLRQSIFSTVFGTPGRKSPNISLTAFLVSECDNMYVTGWGNTQSNFNIGNYFPLSTLGLPTTSDGFRTTTTGDDFYLMVLDTDARELLYATFFGGSEALVHVDGGTSRFDKKGVVYHSVCASCSGDSSFPTTEGAWSNDNGASGGCNNAAFKFDLASLRARMRTNSLSGDDPGLTSICLPDPIVFENFSIGGEIFQWNFGDGSGVTRTDSLSVTHEFSEAGSYLVTLIARDENTCIGVDQTSLVVRVYDGDFTVMDDSSVCAGDEIRLEAAGATTYHWYDPTSTFSSTNQFALVTPEESTTYYIYLEDGVKGCARLDSVFIDVIPGAFADFKISYDHDCFNPPTVTIENLSTGADQFNWDFGDGHTSMSEQPNHHYDSGIYNLKLHVNNGFCDDQKVLQIDTRPVKTYNVISPEISPGKNDYFVIQSPEPVGLIIVDRWGKQVFQADEYQNDWNAEGEPSGVYFYSVIINDQPDCKGWVQVFK